MTRETKPRTIAHLRVSTEKQADHGVSLEAQRAKVAAAAALYHFKLVEILVDAGASAKTLEREGLRRALGMLRGGRAEALLVVKLDRLTRSVKDLGQLVEEYFASGRWALLSVGEQVDTRTAAGRLVLNVLASVAQWSARPPESGPQQRCSTRPRSASTSAAIRLTATAFRRTVCASSRRPPSSASSTRPAPFGSED